MPIDQKTGNLRAVQLLAGHRKMGITVRYLGGDIEDALRLSEGIDLSSILATGACCAGWPRAADRPIRHSAGLIPEQPLGRIDVVWPYGAPSTGR